MSAKTAVVIGLVLLGVSGLADIWLRSGRANSEAVAEGVQKLELLPSQLGGWHGEDIPLQELVVEIAGCAAYQSKQFTHWQTGRSCYVSLMVGLPGPLSEHLPEVCLPSQSFTQVRNSFRFVDLKTITSPPQAGTLANMRFVHPQTPERSVWHGWFDGEEWRRPGWARVTLAGLPVLYRLQVTADVMDDPLVSGQQIDPGEEFLRDNLTALTQLLEQPVPAAQIPLDLSETAGDNPAGMPSISP